jgi:hypothetical protein
VVLSDGVGQNRPTAPVDGRGRLDAVLIGTDASIYAGIGNPYLSQQ